MAEAHARGDTQFEVVEVLQVEEVNVPENEEPTKVERVIVQEKIEEEVKQTPE